MATAELKEYIKLFIKQVNASKSRDDPVRNQLNLRTQAYIVNPRVILKEILRPESPYKPRLNSGELSPQDLRAIARDISKDYWEELKKTASKYSPYSVSGHKLPSDFFDDSRITVAVDNSKRIIYYRGTKTSRDFYSNFRDGIVKPTIDRVKGRADPLNNLRIYVSPDQKYVDALNRVEEEVNQNLIAEGKPTTGGIAQNRRRRARNAYLEKVENQTVKPWQGIQLGHVFGAKASGAAGLLANPHNVVNHLDNLTLGANLAELEPELQQIITDTIKYDITAVWERVFNDSENHARLTLLIPESYVNNTFTGGTAGKQAQLKLNNIVRDLAKNIHKLQGSPSPEQYLVKKIEDLFLGKKPKNVKKVSKAKLSGKQSNKIAIRNIPSNRVKINRTGRNPEAVTNTQIDLTSLIGIINNNLHDKIQQNMGKGGAEQILNYRTGRFARSAKVQNLSPSREKGMIEAQVKYMRYPYGVFEPGGRLYKPGRDPHRIFAISIRQILQEQRIAKLRRVKVNLNG